MQCFQLDKRHSLSIDTSLKSLAKVYVDFMRDWDWKACLPTLPACPIPWVVRAVRTLNVWQNSCWAWTTCTRYNLNRRILELERAPKYFLCQTWFHTKWPQPQRASLIQSSAQSRLVQNTRKCPHITSALQYLQIRFSLSRRLHFCFLTNISRRFLAGPNLQGKLAAYWVTPTAWRDPISNSMACEKWIRAIFTNTPEN